MRARHLICVFGLLALWPRSAAGHARSVSYSHWVGDDAAATVQLQLRELDMNALSASLSRSGATVNDYLTGALILRSSETACAADSNSVVRLTSRTGWVRFEWNVACSQPPTGLHSDLLVDIVTGHIHITRVDLRGRARVDYVFTEDQRSIAIGASAQSVPRHQLALRYVRLGIAHLLSGWDHMVFLLVLVFVATSLREVALTVTGFTIGHTVTLVLSTLGYASANVSTVEALIGLSIALVAVENVWLSERRRSFALPATVVGGVLACAAFAWVGGGVSPLALIGIALFAGCYLSLLADAENPIKLRWGVAGLFGLIHGFGFAGAIQQLSPSSEHLALALAGFNVGVELGQLAVLVVAWPLVLLLRRQPALRTWTVQISSAAALGVGLFWFVARV